MTPRIHLFASLLLVAALGVLPQGGCTGIEHIGPDGGALDGPRLPPRPETGPCGPAPAATHRDVAYATIPGVAQKLLSLDIYLPPRPDACRPVPVVIWVHGGTWATGDKANGITDKVKLLGGAGLALVSVNHRLSPNPPATSDPKRVMHPIHAQDLARAIDWVWKKIGTYGGDPKRIALLGHAAGAHLTALVSTDRSFLGAHGHPLGVLSGTASLDTEAYDIPATMATASGATLTTLLNAFGSDQAVWRAASPTTHVAAGQGIPPFLLLARGMRTERQMVMQLAQKLNQAGAKTTVIDARGLSRSQVEGAIGQPGETVITPALMTFLRGCFGP